MSKPNQRRLAGDIPPLRPADIVPFPQVKRVHFVEKTAARIAAARSREAGENMLETAVQKQCRALERRGVPPERIARQRRALESALRASIWRLVLTPTPPDDGA
jgi:Family of unknown function (DUF6074)